ncbi:MAG: PAS domain S-box protein [Bdellovibrionota bacterium]
MHVNAIPEALDFEEQFLFRRLVEHMNEGVWIVDNDHRTLYVNPKFCSMMGCDCEDVVGVLAYDLFDEASRHRVRRIDKTERSQGISSSYEATIVTKRGERIPALISGAPLSEGRTLGIITDLRELKKREERERLLNFAMSYASDGMIVVNRSGNIEFWNKGAKTIFGYSKEEVIGAKLSVIFDEADVESVLGPAEIRYRLEFSAKHKNAQRVTVSTTVNPLPETNLTESGPISLLIVRDITAERKFEEELALKYQKMREAYNKLGVVRRQLDYVFELAEMCQQFEYRKPVADYVVNSMIMLTRSDACILRCYNEKTGILEMISSFGVNEKWRSKASIPLKNGLVEKAFEQGAPLKVVDLTKEPRYGSLHMARAHNFSSLLVIPLIFQTKLIGSMSLYVTPEKKLEIFENEFIEQYARMLSVMLAHLRPDA